jgi:hypothetical protein
VVTWGKSKFGPSTCPAVGAEAAMSGFLRSVLVPRGPESYRDCSAGAAHRRRTQAFPGAFQRSYWVESERAVVLRLLFDRIGAAALC